MEKLDALLDRLKSRQRDLIMEAAQFDIVPADSTAGGSLSWRASSRLSRQIRMRCGTRSSGGRPCWHHQSRALSIPTLPIAIAGGVGEDDQGGVPRIDRRGCRTGR